MGVKAVHFDGATYLQHDPFLNVPPNSRYGLLSFWYRSSSFSSSPTIFETVDGSNNNSILAEFDSGGSNFSVQLVDGPNYDNWRELIVDTPSDGNWHHILCSWDTQALVFYVYVDDSARTIGYNFFNDTAFDVTYSASYLWRVGTGQVSPFQNVYIGDLAELFFLAGIQVDITDPDVRAKFIDPDTLLPVAIDAGGLWPFFDSLGVVPQIWLSGNQDLFPRNYPGWSATCVSQTDSDPTSQFTVVGNLTTADDDPFGQSGTGV